MFVFAVTAGLLSATIPAGAAPPHPLFCCRSGQVGKVTVTAPTPSVSKPVVGVCCVAGTRGNAGAR